MANLTVTIQEDLTINSAQVGGTNTKTISSITDVYKRTITCQNGQQTTAVVFAEQEYTTQTALDLGDTKYVRCTNLDDTNTVEIAYVLTDGAETSQNFHVKVGPGESCILFSAEEISFVETDAVPSFGTMIDLSKIMIRPVEAADVRVEIFIASV